MQLLLEEYPQAAKERTSKGSLPLHLVIAHMGGAEGLQAVQLLLKEYPEAAKEKAPDGWLPLHQVARYMGGAEGLEAMQLLLKEYPQAAKEKQSRMAAAPLCGTLHGRRRGRSSYLVAACGVPTGRKGEAVNRMAAHPSYLLQ
jgi:hypothetical protein